MSVATSELRFKFLECIINFDNSEPEASHLLDVMLQTMTSDEIDTVFDCLLDVVFLKTFKSTLASVLN